MAEVPTVIAGVGVCASICRCFTGDNICCRMCKRCCKSEDTSDSPGQSTPARISNWMFDICTCKNCKCISCGIINCCSCYKSVTEPTDPQSNELMATERRQRSSDVREATASGDENTSLLATAEVHQATTSVEHTVPPANIGLDASPVPRQPTNTVSSFVEISQDNQSSGIIPPSPAREGQSSAGQDSTDAAVSTQMAAQPARQSSTGLDSVDATVAGRNQLTTGPPIVPTAHGTPASTVPSASNEQHPPMSHQPVTPAQPASLHTSLGTPASTVQSASNERSPPINQQLVAPVEAQPPVRNQPFIGTSGTPVFIATDASSTASCSDSVPQNPNKRVTEEHMGKLAGLIVDWERLASLLGICRADIHAYKVDNNTEWNRKYAMLCGWLNRAYREATVGSLFIKCQEADVDVKVYDYLLNI